MTGVRLCLADREMTKKCAGSWVEQVRVVTELKRKTHMDVEDLGHTQSTATLG